MSNLVNLEGPGLKEIKEFSKKYQWIIIITIIIIVLGSLFHYFHEWSGENGIVGTFAATDESVYQHLKLVFFPLIIAALIQYYFTQQNNLAPGIFIGALVGILFVVVAFYTYTGAITNGKSYVVVDIIIFAISALLAAITAVRVFKQEQYSKVIQILAFALVVGIGLEFAIYTYFPPNVALFEEEDSYEH